VWYSPSSSSCGPGTHRAQPLRGRSQDLSWAVSRPGLGQALSAAVPTVPADRLSTAARLFLRPERQPFIVYDVDRIRDGNSFTTRRVVAIQHGQPIFNLSASFQVTEEGFTHQDEMPTVPEPEGLLSEQALAARFMDHAPEWMRTRTIVERPLELRPVDPLDVFKPQAREPRHMVWYRASGELPDNPALHRSLLTYASDFSFVATAMLPHGVSWMTPGMQVASLDHAMWFYQPFRMDEWLLHVMESPSPAAPAV
jgi:acyl-CoA thioesterase-2